VGKKLDIYSRLVLCILSITCVLICSNKKETRSYLEIAQSLGVDTESQILFVTDVYQEAVAAKAAGKYLVRIRKDEYQIIL
jgi:methionine salvage enolase-phosphatase E1